MCGFLRKSHATGHRRDLHCVASGKLNFEGAKIDMNKKIVLILMLATGMAFAQNRGAPPDQQQPSQQQTQPTQPSATQKSPTSAGQNALTGCLKGSGDAW